MKINKDFLKKSLRVIRVYEFEAREDTKKTKSILKFC